MKVYLIDPNKKWYKANLHCHTNNSDGYYSPLEIKKYYMEQGYNIVAYTDHDLIFDVSELTDDNFVAITSSEYSISEKGKTMQDLKTIHLCLFAKDPHNIVHIAASKENFSRYHIDKYNGKEILCDGYHRIFTKESIQETINRANKAGFLVQLNHPSWSLMTREDYIDLEGLWGLEIYNYLTELETGTEYCINIYEDMLRSGKKLVCTMNDDNHNFRGSFDGSFGGYNYIGLNKKLTYNNVLKAMEEGYIYASNGPIIESLYIDTKENKICISCNKATDIILCCKNRNFRNVHGVNLTSHEFDIRDNDVYFRITIKDEYGKVAHSHVYYLEDYGYKVKSK